MPVLPEVSKSSIRKNTLTLREQLSPEMHAAHSKAIAERLLQLPEYRQAGAVLGYMNFGAEFASEVWIRQVLAARKKLALPRVNHHTSQLDLFWVEDLENQLATGLWGIREPIVERCERVITLNEVEFALLPGVAFSKNGARLGYGGGFYDKLLIKQLAIRLGEQTTLAKSLDMAHMTHRPTLAAAAFELQIMERIPQEVTDVKVEWIITEQRTINCSA